MKKMNFIYFITLISIILVSCEEVIDIDLNSSASQIVIEGVVTDKPGPYEVKISKTVDFYSPSSYPQVSGATVIIQDDAGNHETLEEIEPGLYRTDTLQGVVGRTYTLSVNIDGKEYLAKSTMIEPLKIDSLSYEYADFGFGGGGPPKKGFYLLHCFFNDRPEIHDYAVLRVFKNDTILDRNFLYDGKFTDGNKVDFNRFGGRFDKGDNIRVELVTMSDVNFEYVSTLNNVIADEAKGPGGFKETGTPANPNSNLTNKALGFFGAYSIDKESIVIK